jgi:hypothetical protein
MTPFPERNARRAVLLILGASLAAGALTGAGLWVRYGRIGALPYPQDEITLRQVQLESMRSDLPAVLTVGLASDHFSKQDRFLVQYALAPVGVREGTEAEFVIVAFRDSVKERTLVENSRLVLVKDLGDGTRLFRRAKD